ncbi:hypothetical protein L7F22_017875 [Adiantum nelumboides]|nr:hypothetical protein [Adiantum nelumboides]
MVLPLSSFKARKLKKAFILEYIDDQGDKDILCGLDRIKQGKFLIKKYVQKIKDLTRRLNEPPSKKRMRAWFLSGFNSRKLREQEVPAPTKKFTELVHRALKLEQQAKKEKSRHQSSSDSNEVEDVASLAARIAAIRFILPIAEQAHWDVKDAQAHALSALSMKRTITPHICSTKFAKQAWDILASLYAGRNEAKIALLHKELESKIMNEKDDMYTFLAGVKDINEQLISVGEVISDSSLVQTILDALPDSPQSLLKSNVILMDIGLQLCCFKKGMP